jgi:Tfp pilus assembly protein PilV
MRVKISGEGLIEIMIALLIMAGCVIALLRFQLSVVYNDSISQQRSEANLLAIKRLEILRDFQVLSTQSPYAAYQDIVSGVSTVVGSGATYTVTWTVTNYSNPTYKNLNVNVTWTDRYNVSVSVLMISNVAGIDPKQSAVII